MTSKNFALIGAAGFIAPRHLKAIKETGNRLISAFDPNDSVGILDSFFPDSDFFVEFERFDRNLDKLKRQGVPIDYISICSPNYLHDSHIRFALRLGADAICEKPIVLNPWNVEALMEIEKETNKKVWTILQLRHHEEIIKLKQKVENEIRENPKKHYSVELTYLTSRGNWYFISWKGDEKKSGGIATNIGVHFFDMLTWIFGKPKENSIHINKLDTASGLLELDRATVRWFLSVNANYLPEDIIKSGKRTFRSILIDSKEIEFSEGFSDLHTISYQSILKEDGFRISDAKQSILIVQEIRNKSTKALIGDFHPFCKKVE